MARIAVLIPNMRGGGAERVALNLAGDFLAAGHMVDLVVMEATGELMPLLPPQVRVIDLGARRVRSAIRPLIGYLRSERPDAVQVSMWPLTVAAVIAHRLARSSSRLLLSEHVPLSRQYARWGRIHMMILRSSVGLFYPLADARVAVSERAADDLARVGGLDRATIEVIYNPIAPPPPLDVAPGANIEAFWGPGDFKRILSVGSLISSKNYRLLIEAFAKLRQHVSAKLMIVGEGELRRDLQALAAQLHVADDVLLPGFQAEVWPFYDAADLFVLSSDYEGFGNVLVEALFRGLPVVSTDCESGPREILDGGAYGTLVPCNDRSALSDAMVAALGAPRDKQRLQARARSLSGEGNSGRYLDFMLRGPDSPA